MMLVFRIAPAGCQTNHAVELPAATGVDKEPDLVAEKRGLLDAVRAVIDLNTGILCLIFSLSIYRP